MTTSGCAQSRRAALLALVSGAIHQVLRLGLDGLALDLEGLDPAPTLPPRPP